MKHITFMKGLTLTLMLALVIGLTGCPDPAGTGEPAAKTLIITGIDGDAFFSSITSTHIVVLLGEDGRSNVPAGAIAALSSKSEGSLSIPLKKFNRDTKTFTETDWTGTGSFMIVVYESDGTTPEEGTSALCLTNPDKLINFSDTNTVVAASKFVENYFEGGGGDRPGSVAADTDKAPTEE
jgi:hypothetical protein